MIGYIDSSALVKLVIVEDETGIVEDLWDRVGDRYVSLIGYAELRSAIAAAARSRRIDETTVRTTRDEVETLWMRLAAVEVDASIVREAGELSDRHGLHAGDAVHLAAALRVADGPTAFIAFDARLRDAAAAEGFIVFPERA